MVHKAHKARVVVVSPSLLALAIQVMQSLCATRACATSPA